MSDGRPGLVKRSFAYVSDNSKQDDVEMNGKFGFGLKDALTIMCYHTVDKGSVSFEYRAITKAGTYYLVPPLSPEAFVQIRFEPSKKSTDDTVTQVISCTDSGFLETTLKSAKAGILQFAAEGLDCVAQFSCEATKGDPKSVIAIELYIRKDDKTSPFDNEVFCHNIKYEPGGPIQKNRKFAFMYHLKMMKKEGVQGRDRLALPQNWSKFLSSLLMRAFSDPEFLRAFTTHFDRVQPNVENDKLWFGKQTTLAQTYWDFLKLRADEYAAKQAKEEELKAKRVKIAEEIREQQERVKCIKQKLPSTHEQDAMLPTTDSGDFDEERLHKAIIGNAVLESATTTIKTLSATDADLDKKQTELKAALKKDKVFQAKPILIAASSAQAQTDGSHGRVIPMPDSSLEKAKTQGNSSLSRILSEQSSCFPLHVMSCETKITRICEALGWESPTIRQSDEHEHFDALAEVSTIDSPRLVLNIRPDTTPEWLLDAAIEAILQGHDHAKLLIRSLIKNSDSPPSSPRAAPLNSKPVSLLLVISEWGTEKGGIASFNMQLAIDLASNDHHVYVLVTEWSESLDAGHSNVTLVPPYRLGSKWPMPYMPGSESKIAAIVGHAHITGPLALYISKQPQFKNADFWIINHCARSWYNPLKAKYNYMETCKNEDELVAIEEKAAVVWSVGETILEYWSEQFTQKGIDGVNHVLFQPTLNPYFVLPSGGVKRARTRDRSCTLLLFGRLDDDVAKGVGVGINTFKTLHHAHKAARREPPTLIIRGIKDAEERAELRDKFGLDRYTGRTVQMREFGTPENVKGDLRKADLVLMPSPIEPYGLVGLESLAMGVPLLCNSESGLARDMVKIGGRDLSSPFIVDGISVEEWTKAAQILLDSDASAERSPFERAGDLRTRFQNIPAKDRGYVQMWDALQNR